MMMLGAEGDHRDPMGLGVPGLQTSTPFLDHWLAREPSVLSLSASGLRNEIWETECSRDMSKEQLFLRPLMSHRNWVTDVVCKPTYLGLFCAPLKAWAMWKHSKLQS